VANRFQAISQASMTSARLINTVLASQWLRSKRRAEQRSAFRRSPRRCILLGCRIIAAIGVPGGTFFFTVNLLDRRSNLLVANIDALRDPVRRVRARALFHIGAGVVLPDHMHCLWTLPQSDADFPGRWRAIKTGFAKSLPIGEPQSPVMTRRGERGIWQRRYWEHTIRDDRDFAAHMDYTRFNPVKHGLVAHPADWPHSSFRRCAASGMYPADWRGGSDEPQQTGERQ
jgi:putative transposase